MGEVQQASQYKIPSTGITAIACHSGIRVVERLEHSVDPDAIIVIEVPPTAPRPDDWHIYQAQDAVHIEMPAEAEPDAAGDTVTNTITGGTIHGPALQGRDFIGGMLGAPCASPAPPPKVTIYVTKPRANIELTYV